jgi:phenylacetate-CoA ligase
MTEKAALPHVAWPEITGKGLECLVSLINSLETTQHLTTLELERCQRIQLEVLAAYAARHSPFFAGRLKRAHLKPADFGKPGALQRLDVLHRRDIQQAGSALRCAEVPPRHLPLNKGETSGSTGEPVVVIRTALNRLFWMAMTMREHLWNTRDFALRSTSVRASIPALAYKDDWGPPANLLYKTGRSQGIPITADAAQQAAWISDFDPGYLMHYPNSLEALCDHCEKHAIRFTGLRQIRSIGETLSPALRTRAQKILGARVVDTYSSNEVGVIAIECPVSGLYHVMAENLVVEIVGEDGTPCKSGEIGRVIVTDLHNFATSLVRYDIGDYAEVAGPCPCGRGLPALRRILGRERNLVAMPDGTRHWPLVGFHAFRDVAPVLQYQLVQHDSQNIEMRLVVERGLTSAEEGSLRDIVVGALACPFTIRFTYLSGNIPRGPGGKFEEFICLVG